MNIADKTKLIELLLKLIQDEEQYKAEYKANEKIISDKREAGEEIKWNDPLYNYYWTHRAPTDANLKDAGKIIGRLGFRISNNKEEK